jgi:hypothetical protein
LGIGLALIWPCEFADHRPGSFGAPAFYRVGYRRKREVFAMQRVNELFGKEIVRQNSGEKQGNVRDIHA